jgi:hypothetical protein
VAERGGFEVRIYYVNLLEIGPNKKIGTPDSTPTEELLGFSHFQSHSVCPVCPNIMQKIFLERKAQREPRQSVVDGLLEFRDVGIRLAVGGYRYPSQPVILTMLFSRDCSP